MTLVAPNPYSPAGFLPPSAEVAVPDYIDFAVAEPGKEALLSSRDLLQQYHEQRGALASLAELRNQDLGHIQKQMDAWASAQPVDQTIDAKITGLVNELKWRHSGSVRLMELDATQTGLAALRAIVQERMQAPTDAEMGELLDLPAFTYLSQASRDKLRADLQASVPCASSAPEAPLSALESQADPQRTGRMWRLLGRVSFIRSFAERRAARRAGQALGASAVEVAPAPEAGPSVGENAPAFAPKAELSSAELRQQIKAEMTEIMAKYIEAVARHEVIVPEDEQVRISLRRMDISEIESRLPKDWRPREVYMYSTVDPWQQANPDLTAIVKEFIASTVAVTERVQTDVAIMRAAGLTIEKGLTYEGSTKRNGKGKQPTVVTAEICNADPDMSRWIYCLPDAEGLYIVAHPNGGTFLYDKTADRITNLPSSPALKALTLGAMNGRAVREREALIRHIFTECIDLTAIADQEFRLADIGSGTGDPGMRAATAVLPQLGPNGRVMVDAYDNNANSLEVATFMADQLARELPDPNSLEFRPHMVDNFVSPEGMDLLQRHQPHVAQSVGLSEYIARENPKTAEEQNQRKIMQRLGMLSAEAFYAGVYDALPPGSWWLTGNMQPNSESKFVEDGLGWGSILIRGLEEYLDLVRDSGIPGKGSLLFVPDPQNSAAVYNILAFHKM